MLSKFFSGLKKTKDAITSIFTSLDYDALEEALILSDVGFDTVGKIISRLKEKKIKDMEAAKAELRSIIEDMVTVESTLTGSKVKLFIGVNGVGKTTNLSKLASKYKNDGKKVLLVAGDTFRAGASEQLSIWAERLSLPIVKQGEGADSASVVYDALGLAKAKDDIDYVFVDTAGRMHNNSNLIGELDKIVRVVKKHEKPDIFLVLDALTGQNAISQAKEFSKIADITGIILTKLDSTAKGGVAITLCDELSLPIIYAGVGETADDLIEFDPKEFAEAII